MVNWIIFGIFVALVLGVAADIYSTSDTHRRRAFDRARQERKGR